MTWDNTLPLLIILSAVLPGIVIFTLDESRRKIRTTLNLLAAFSCIGLIAFMLVGVYQGEVFKTRLPLLPEMDLVLHADALSLLFATLSGVLWLVTTIYAIGYLEGSPNRSRFFGFFSLCVGTTMGIALAGNLITFLIFYELLTLTTYPLVVHKGNKSSLAAGKKYLQYTMVGGALLLAGVVWLQSIVGGALDFTATGILRDIPGLEPLHLQIIFALIIIGLGVKAALVPLHGWLPSAMAAPAPVSSLLHAVAVVKAGAFGIVRVVYDVYGIEFSQQLGLTIGLAIVASITIIYGSVRALYQNDLKKRLAYSTVSQVSYIILGTAIAGPIATIGGIVHLVHQGLMKITMFFCAGNLAETLGVHKVSQLNGAGRRMPLTMAAFSLAALGMIGIPPAAGFISKWYLGLGALEVEFYWVLGVLAISSLLNAMYFLPILYAAWFKPQTQPWPKTAQKYRFETHWMLLLPPVVTAFFALLVGLLAGYALSPLSWANLIAAREYGQTFEIAVSQAGHLLPNLWWAVLVPLMLALLLTIARFKQLQLWLICLAAVPALITAVTFEQSANTLPWLFFSSEMVLGEDNRLFLLLAGLLWFGVGLFSCGYLRDDKRRGQFILFALMAMSGNFGLILAQDVLGFITFFTLMSLASYGLIVHNRTDAARQAGNTYMKWVVVGEVLLFAAFTGLVFNGAMPGSNALNVSAQPQWVTVLFFVGFAIKAGVFTVHMWLPRAHPVAPVPASALLSGIMVKAGVLGWLKFIPLGVVEYASMGQTVMVLGLIGAFFGVLVGLTQRDPKALLAYSTLSQMGIVTAAFGTGLTHPQLWPVLLPAILLYSVHHGVAKATLFLSVGIAPLWSNTRYRVFVYLAIMIPAMFMAGLPLTSGALAKFAMKDALGLSGVLATLLPITAIGTSWLMLRFLQLMVDKQSEHASASNPHVFTLSGYLFMLLLSLGLCWYLPGSEAYVAPMLTLEATWQSFWPYLTALLLFIGAQRFIGKVPMVPPGDLLGVWNRLIKGVSARSQGRFNVDLTVWLANRIRPEQFNLNKVGRVWSPTAAQVERVNQPGVIFIVVLMAVALVIFGGATVKMM